jgi:hypothetical protein
MEGTDLFLVGAEVSVAFAGFAGIIATFQFREVKEIKRGDVVGLTMIVQMSLNCALCSVLPLLLSMFNLSATSIWTICSIYGGFYTAYSMQSLHRSMYGATKRMSLRLLFGSFQVLFGCVVVVQFLNASDLFFHREPGPYVAGIIIGLGLVGYMFGRLLLRPLWTAVRIQEANKVDLASSI